MVKIHHLNQYYFLASNVFVWSFPNKEQLREFEFTSAIKDVPS